ncbi:MAG: class I SAM-dependent methyltransferase [Candidatus ainarchaeum sp.]|nr:class I SAM-dependent methyltransferase [Candidatus ainarchaeum sp.]
MKKNDFLENTDYSQTSNISIWGTGDKDTLELLDKIEIRGKWLNLAAGDGRYNLKLLEKADSVVASDINEGALAKLSRTTPEQYKAKLHTKAFDLTKRFPFEDGAFDGVFCAGTLHFFSKEILEGIFAEIGRVLKPRGKVMIDFATDVRRIFPDGSIWVKKGEPGYKQEEAAKFLEESFRNYKIEARRSKVDGDDVTINSHTYTFSCNYILIVGEKK